MRQRTHNKRAITADDIASGGTLEELSAWGGLRHIERSISIQKPFIRCVRPHDLAIELDEVTDLIFYRNDVEHLTEHGTHDPLSLDYLYA